MPQPRSTAAPTRRTRPGDPRGILVATGVTLGHARWIFDGAVRADDRLSSNRAAVRHGSDRTVRP